MSDATGMVEGHTAHTGTVFDIGYQGYTGVREGRGRARIAIVKDGIRSAFGLGRGGRAKVLPWFFISALAAIALVMALVIGAAEKFGGPGAAAQANLPSHSDFYGIASVIVFVFAAIIAPELLCRDRRDGVINLYLVRPLTGTDYIASRWLACLLVMLVATWVPQFILFAGFLLGNSQPAQYLQDHWMDVPRFLAAGAAMAAYATGLAMLTASFTTRRAYASVFLVGLFIITTPFTVGLAEEIEGSAGRWISMFNLTSIPVHVNDVIFGDVSEMTEDAPARQLSDATRVWWWALWTVVPTSIVWWRYRRMTP